MFCFFHIPSAKSELVKFPFLIFLFPLQVAEVTSWVAEKVQVHHQEVSEVSNRLGAIVLKSQEVGMAAAIQC